jgi:hypothetical protein
MKSGREPDLKQALRPVPAYERAVREVSKMLQRREFATRWSGRSGLMPTARGPARLKTSPSWSATRRSRPTRAGSSRCGYPSSSSTGSTWIRSRSPKRYASWKTG